MSNLNQKTTEEPYCPHCKGEIEDEHHIFISCQAYSQAKQEAIEKIAAKIGEEAREHMTKTFQDGEWWKGGRSRYYLGWVPKTVPATASREIHTEVMKVAGRIWGMRTKWKYEMEKEREGGVRSKAELE